VYLAEPRHNKRHDVLLRAARATGLSGHCHPVPSGALDLSGTRITTSAWDEADVAALLRTSRIAVYPGDRTSNPAAMWECVAAGLPIVVNRKIAGGRFLVVPGVTGELADEDEFGGVMRRVVEARERYRPREHLLEAWEPVAQLERYLAFFARMGWSG
jgi:hypothetical protein